MGTYTKMKTFVTVVQEHSFNQAATKLKTSAAEVSRRISALEADLKVKLINRTTRKLALTQLGEIYYEDCKKILFEVHAANQRILSQQEEPSGILCVHYIESSEILPMLQRFIHQYPQVTLKLFKAEQMPDFDKQKMDMTIGLSEYAPIPENCVRKKIGKNRYVLCGSPAYLAQTKPIKKPSDLSVHRYISHIGRMQDGKIEFKDDITIHIQPFLFMNDSEEMVKVAMMDLGLILVHESRVRDYLKAKQLVEVLPQYALPEVNCYIVYPYARYLERKIRVFLDFFGD